MNHFVLAIVGALLLSAQNAEELLTNGIEQFHKGQYSSARASFEKALALSPADARALGYLAVTRAAMGECGHALSELRHQFQRNREPELRRLSGLAVIDCLLRQNEFSEVLVILGELENLYPADPDVLYTAARVHRLGWSSAMGRLMRTAPDSWQIHELNAELLENQSRWPEAAAEYRKAIVQNPAALRLHYRLGRVLQHTPDGLEPARKEFQTELTLNPLDVASEYYLGEIDLTQDKPSDAAGHFERALTLYPEFAEAQVGMGRVKLALKQTSEAIHALERAVQLQPNLHAAHYNLMLAYRAAGKTKQAQHEEELAQKLQQRSEAGK